MEIQCKIPWPKVQFKTESGQIYDGYAYMFLGDCFYISENQAWSSKWSQNWIINWRNIIKFYDDKYGLKCTCGARDNNSEVHTLICKWSTINTDLL